MLLTMHFLEEERRINDSIISEVRNFGIKQGIKTGYSQAKNELILNMNKKIFHLIL